MKDTKTKKLRRIAMAIKGFTGTIGMSALIADYKWVGIAILVLGALANEVINATEKKDDDITKP